MTRADDELARHLKDRYEIEVAGLERLDEGVFRVDHRGGVRWVARVFAHDGRPFARVKEDAAILRGLERAGFPAERCAHDEPVSEFPGHSVLVTSFLEDHGPLKPGAPAAILGALLGRLHKNPATGLRAGGAWHHLSSEGGPREEIAAAAELLDQHVESVSLRELALLDRLRDEVEQADGCHDLPHAFVHPDFVPANAISTAEGRLAIVDWAGSGRGPRLWSLGFLLWAAGARHPRLIDVAVSRYRRSIELETEELERLEAAIRGRPIMLEVWSVCVGRRQLSAAVDRIDEARTLAASIAVRARQAFAAR
jgi:Ser/Thr protein kinase RdoA (MazF antagonist)